MTPDFIRADAMSVVRREDGNIDLFVLGDDGAMNRIRIGMDDPDLFVEDGTFTFSNSHGSKNQVRYAS